MFDTLTLTGGGGTRLHAVATGPSDAPPIVFIHGLLMSHLVWLKQFESMLAESNRLLAFDLRGHGMSEKPEGFEPYRQSRLWAEDVAAAVEACARPPVVVVWSYGGLVLGNYLHHFGDAALAGIVHCSAIVAQGMGNPPPGADTPVPFLSEDLGTAIPALNGFSHALTAGELSQDDFAMLTAQAITAPAHARRGCLMRSENVCPDYAGVTKPALVITAEADPLVNRKEAEDAVAAMPHAQFLSYPDVGHMPFWEDPDRFNADLIKFIEACSGGNS